jgi:hypothetical protein
MAHGAGHEEQGAEIFDCPASLYFLISIKINKVKKLIYFDGKFPSAAQ